MNDRKVLVTGAAGFVGSRLVERLTLGTDYKVKAMIRQFSGPGLARLARLPVELVLADLLDVNALTEAAQGCELIVHCAYGNSGSSKQRKEVTISGTENILKAALRGHARKVIYLSSAAVHGRNPKSPVVDESAPFGKDGDAYSVSKIEAEKIVWRYHQEHGLPVVVFRPALIYGPYSKTWTVGIVKEIQTGAILVNGGNGAANLIYVDNLIDAILLAMDKASGDGEAFLLVDDEQLTWKDVYQCYAEMIESHPPLQSMTLEEIEAMRKASQPSTFNKWVVVPWQITLEMGRYVLQTPEIASRFRGIPWVKFGSRFVPRRIKDLVKGDKSRAITFDSAIRPNRPQLPPKDMVELYASPTRFSNEKAKRILGHTQRITFDEAIELTHSWLRYQRLIP